MNVARKLNSSLKDSVLKHEQEFNNEQIDQEEPESNSESPITSPGKLFLSSFFQFIGTLFSTFIR